MTYTGQSKQKALYLVLRFRGFKVNFGNWRLILDHFWTLRLSGNAQQRKTEQSETEALCVTLTQVNTKASNHKRSLYLPKKKKKIQRELPLIFVRLLLFPRQGVQGNSQSTNKPVQPIRAKSGAKYQDEKCSASLRRKRQAVTLLRGFSASSVRRTFFQPGEPCISVSPRTASPLKGDPPPPRTTE